MKVMFTSKLQDIANTLWSGFYDEMDSVLLNAMAYGISASEFVLTRPELVVSDHKVTIVCRIGTTQGR